MKVIDMPIQVEYKVGEVFRICNSYESGVGKGLNNSTFKSGDHLGNSKEKEAYIIGYEFGKRRREQRSEYPNIPITGKPHSIY